MVSDGKMKFLSEEQKCNTGFQEYEKERERERVLKRGREKVSERERERKKDEEEKSYCMKIIPSVKPTEENEQMRK